MDDHCQQLILAVVLFSVIFEYLESLAARDLRVAVPGSSRKQ